MAARKRALPFVAVALVAATASLLAAPASAIDGPYAAVRTRIAVKLDDRLTSQEARLGDTFSFETTSSVAVDGRFLPAGTHGHGVIVRARAARGPRGGELELEARSLDLARGDTLAVGLEPGQLDVAGMPVRFGGEKTDTNVVFERGTPFIVVAPPQPSPEPTTAG